MTGGGRAHPERAARTSLSAIALLAALAATPAHAAAVQTSTSTAAEPAPEDRDVTFSAEQLDYDDTSDVVIATGDVRMLHAGSRLRADQVVWDRKSGQVRAIGHVAVVNPGGDTAYADQVTLTDDMKNGVADNLLLVLSDGGRLVARHGARRGEVETLDRAAYTPCRVVNDAGCPREPSWKITALRIVHDGVKHRIYYRDARFSVFGQTLLWLPAFSHPDGSNQAGGNSGLLLPNIQYSKVTGFEVTLPYYWQIAPNRDLTITPHLYTTVAPALEGLYRSLGSHGAYSIRGELTYGSRQDALDPTTAGLGQDRSLRGFIDADGTWQLGPNWTIHGQLRLETDRTFMKRYDISNDDRLRSTLDAERIGDNSYLSIAGWYVQTVRVGDVQGQQPIALPAIDYRRRLTDPWLGGVLQLQLNSLALTRTTGQDTQRAFAGARWDVRRLTPMGQEITLTGYLRADAYHTDQIDRTATTIYRGHEGWQGRGIAAAAVDMRWPFIGELWGGTQQIVPRVQIVGSPPTRNLEIPDEDSRAVDLEDTNLFSLDRFSGYDRWEDGARITYGVEWNYDRPKVQVRAVAGQSYRLTSERTILPDGTGLSRRFSDYVGRLSFKYGEWIELTERFRLDKSSLAVRRNEADLTLGTRKTYLLLGYLYLHREIDTSIEDLRDRQEIRLGGRIQIARYWSIFGSTIVDLTTKKLDPTSLSDGYQPVRQRLGIVYEDECISLGLTWRRDYDPTVNARHGNTFSLRLALKNVGR